MITLATRFDERDQVPAWKNEVACDLNVMLRRLCSLGVRQFNAGHFQSELRIVTRVAEFEGIQLKGQCRLSTEKSQPHQPPAPQ